MKVGCVCPTYKRPRTTMMSAWWFLQQTYEGEAILYILDDGASFLNPHVYIISNNKQIILESREERFPTLAEKSNYIFKKLYEEFNPDVYVLWDSDDLHLPWRLESIVNGLQQDKTATFIYPTQVFSCNANMRQFYLHNTFGRFHATAAFTRKAYRNGCEYTVTKNLAFDITLLDKLLTSEVRGYPVANKYKNLPEYVYYYPCHELPNCSFYGQNWYEITATLGSSVQPQEFKIQTYDKYMEVLESIMPGWYSSNQINMEVLMDTLEKTYRKGPVD